MGLLHVFQPLNQCRVLKKPRRFRKSKEMPIEPFDKLVAANVQKRRNLSQSLTIRAGHL